MNLDTAENRSVAAGEYVLGTLNAQDKARFEALMQTDSSLQEEVALWTEQFMSLAAALPEEHPSQQLWPAIEQSIRTQQATQQVTRPAATHPPAGALARALTFWKSWAWVATATATVLMGVLIHTGGTAPPADRYIAILKSQDKNSEWLVEASAGGTVKLYQIGQLTQSDNSSNVDIDGKSLQLWTKPPGASGPTSLGLVKLGQALVLPASSLPALVAGQLFEVTLEPERGSPINKPTGPILFVGRTVALNQH